MSEFLAEASVLVTPNTAAFAAQLKAEVEAAVAKAGPIAVPVAAAQTGKVASSLQADNAAATQLAATNTQLAASQNAVNAAMRAGAGDLSANTAATELSADAANKKAAAAKTTSAATQSAAKAERLLETSARASAAGQRAVLAATTDLSRARTILLAETRSLERAELAMKAAETGTNQGTRLAASFALAKAEARQVEALATFEAVVAEEALQKTQLKTAATTASVNKAIFASGASFAGIRGAALTANTAFLAATVGVVAFSAAISSAAELETELNTFQVTAGATADQMERVGEAARALGQDVSLPGVSAGEAATSLNELAKAGLSVEDSLAAARGTLQLATAAQIENAEATQFVSSALNAFGLAGNQAVRVADLLSGASIQSQASIQDVGTAFSQAAAAAAQAGVSVEDTIALLTALGQAGLKGSDAGTSLRTAFIRLINPTQKAKDALNELNVQIRDSQGNVRADVFSEISVALQDMTRAQQDATLALIFGQDAFRAAAILGKEGAAGLNEIRDATQETGLASQLAEARTKGFAGQLEALKNSAANLGVELGTVLIPAVGDAITLLTDLGGAAGQATGDVNRAVTELQNLAPGEAGAGFSIKDFFAEDFGAGAFPGLDALRDFRAAQEEIKAGQAATNTETAKLVGNTEQFAAALREVSDTAVLQGAGGGAQSVIQGLNDKFQGTSAEVEEAKQRLNEVARLITALGRAPTLAELKIFIEKGSLTDTEKAIGDLRAAAEEPVPISVVIKPTTEGGPAAPVITADSLIPGDPGKEAAKKIKLGFESELFSGALENIVKNNFEQVVAAASSFGQRFANQATTTTAEFGRQFQLGLSQAFLGAVSIVKQGAQALTDEMNRALISGAGPTTIIGILQQQFADQQRVIDAANKRLAAAPAGPGPARKKATDIRSAALAEQARIQGQIDSEQDKITAAQEAANRDREQKAKDAATKQAKSDQRVIDSISVREDTRFGAREIAAANTKRLSDDIKLAKDRSAFLTAEIARVKKSVQDDETKAKALRDLRERRRKVNDELGDLLREDREAKIAAAEQAADTLAENLSTRTAIAEARGDDDAVLVALNREIANQRKRVKAAKTVSDQLDEELKLQQLLAQKRDLLDNEIKKGQGTTAFDLLQQFSGTFNQNAGNLINGEQPFAGPTGFTADIAQFLVRQQQQTTGTTAGTRAGGGGGRKIDIDDDRLVSSIDRLTDAIERQGGGDGNSSTMPPAAVKALGDRWAAVGRFYASRATQAAVDANSG